ncbi:MAG: tRNA 2-thiouridine(34) synthase MnmA [Candidatus Parcubacteria bacterium]|nr:tRNA 2-thiouridine(34) synthase MnmA [Candidatus Parcubacteria bacterium]
MDVKGKRIFVGLSGGVDSAVSAALLKQAGAQVTGVFIKGWYPPGMPCTWAAERRDAMRVAARLHIPFLTLDASAEYKKHVIDYLLAEYRAGRTPNPDVMCNREVKFGAFYRFAKSQGADAIATGHYRSGEKDQNYFLWAVPKDVLQATLFPVGNSEKKEVRALAKKFNLPVAEKRDSQGICFLGAVSVKEFLEKEFGNDNPALLYTIGQRVPGGYVIGKNVGKKEIIVSEARAGGAREARFTDANWHVPIVQHQVLHISAQTRYRGPRCAGRVEGNRFISSELLPELPAPGQSIVFYQGDELVGGGIITG